ncbi:ankyrin, partial [Cenococcum geophilum 1.58]
NDLWALAAAQLNDEDRRNLDFSRPDKLNILADLHALTEKSKQTCIEKRWKYTRKSGETVILKDVFDKIIRWIDIFKQVGDVAVQYDPVHAALAWAGIRFVLQIAVNDYNKFSAVVEDVAWIAELICRHAVLEGLYLRQTSNAAEELQKALVTLYAAVLIYLTKAKQYLEEGSAKRILKSGLLEFDPYLNDIRTAQDGVRQCTALADRHESMRKKVLKWVSREPYIEHHKQAKQGVLSGTGQWLLSDPVFEKWKKESASSILWLHGIPGSGKSKLVSIVVEDAFNSLHAGRNPQPVYFYCSRNTAEPGRSDPKAILASLAKQLSFLEPGKPLLKPTVDLYKQKEAEDFASGGLQIEESYALIIQLVEQYPLTTIVIDALDECDPGKRLDLLKALEKILRESSGLVKIFVSSRDDHNIVIRLQRYPNLEIKSDRNSDDIVVFVKDQTERLIEDGKLLRCSDSQTEMKELIVKKVIAGANGMFRWASMQLQYLCRFSMDPDIRKHLGKLPPDLDTLYAELYDVLSDKPGELEMAVFRNVLSWLFCAQRTLKSTEFLAVVSTIPLTSKDTVFFSKDLVLQLCNNFVVFNAQLDTFRFAHLSVREFLEKRQEYKSTVTNALAAEACLWDLVSITLNPTSKRFLSVCSQNISANSSKIDEFSKYFNVYWAVHCQLAADERTSDRLKKLFRAFIFGEGGTTCPIELWSARLPQFLGKLNISWELNRQLEDVMVTPASASVAAWFISCAFNLPEILEDLGDGLIPQAHFVNKQGRSLLHVSVTHGSCKSLKILLNRHRDKMQVTEEVVKAAAGNWSSGEEVMALLLDQRGTEVRITEEVVKAAAGNGSSGKGVMALLLDQCGTEVKITEEVVKEAASNESGSCEVIQYLHQTISIKVTVGVIEAAATSGQEQVLCLLDQWDSIGSDKESWLKISCLYNVAKNGDAATVRKLVDDGIPPDKQNIRRVTPLWTASSGGHKAVVQVLLATDAVDVNVRSVSGRTPLFWAAAKGHSEVVHLLLDHSAEQNYMDKDGRSPLSVAQLYHQANAIDILTKHDTHLLGK